MTPQNNQPGISRRDYLKLSGLALGGLAAGATNAQAEAGNCYPTHYRTQRYSYYDRLPTFDPSTRLEDNEMRITFMGSCIPPVRKAQQMMSVFVQVGWDDAKGVPLDQFVFDCGSGVCANYGAMGIPFSQMNKIFISHLHGDHVSDLTHIYCFGPSGDRKKPLYVFGHGDSEVVNPASVPGYEPSYYASTPTTYQDGTNAFCTYLRKALRWHTESFSFESTSYPGYHTPAEIQTEWGLPVLPMPVEDDPTNDGYALIPIELPWKTVGGVAYNNSTTGAKVTHFPVIHTRQGSMGYKVEWKDLSMIYTSDTKPDQISVAQACNVDETGTARGVDVFIHEMIVPPEVWAMKLQGLDEPGSGTMWDLTLEDIQRVQNSSHSPQGSFGYMLSQINPRPRLTVATHFPVADDTVHCALQSVRAQCPEYSKVGDKLVWSFDLMVLRVFPDKIIQCRAVVNDFGFSTTKEYESSYNIPKYHDSSNEGDPYAQIDLTNFIPPEVTDENGNVIQVNYRTDGY